MGAIGVGILAGKLRVEGSRIAKMLFPEKAIRFVANPPMPRLFLLLGIVLAALGQIVFVTAGSKPTTPVLGIVLMAIGLVLFAMGAANPAANVKAMFPDSRVQPPWRIFRGRRFLVPTFVGLILMLGLVLRLLNGSGYSSDLWLWLIAIAAISVPFLQEIRVPKDLTSKRLLYEALFVLALMALFLVLNARDITNWYYSAIGDEYAFYSEAQGIIQGGISRPFSQAGVYGEQPELNSVYQATVMSLFGANHFGWKLASVLLIALSIPGIYIIGRSLGGVRVAIISTVLFSFSHYLFANAHTGYNNVDAILPAVWAIAFFILAFKKGSPLLFFVSGLIAGLGFYTFYSARAVLPIMVIFALTQPRAWRQLLALWPMLLGFILTALPIFAASKGAVVSKMIAQTAEGYSPTVTGPTGERIIANIYNNLLAFNYNPDIFHYVSGSLLDPVTAVLAVLGIGLAIRHITLAPYRLLIIWYAVAITTTGVLSPYPTVAISRLSFVIPPLAILAGMAVSHVWESLPGRFELKDSKRVWIGAFVVLSILVLALNANRFWGISPTKSHLSQEAVAIGALRSPLCGNNYDTTLMVGRGVDALLKPALTSYDPKGKLPRMIDQKDTGGGKPLPLDGVRCIVLMNPGEPEEQLLAAELRSALPQGRFVTFSDKANKGSVNVFVTGTD